MHACGHDMHMTCWVGTARVLAGMKDRWQRHAGVHRPAGRGGRRRGPHDARGRPVQAVPAAGLLPRPALRFPAAARPRRLHRGPGPGQRRFGGHHGPRQGRPRLGPAHHDRPDRPRRPHRPRPANDRQPGDQPARPVRGHGRLDPRRHQAQHHPQRGEAAAHRADARRTRSASTRWRRSSGSPRPRRLRPRRAGAGGQDRPGGVHAGADQRPGPDAARRSACSGKCSGPTTSSRGRRSWAARTSAATAGPGCRSSCSGWARSTPTAGTAARRTARRRCRRCTRTCSGPIPEPTIRTGVLAMSQAVLNLVGK